MRLQLRADVTIREGAQVRARAGVQLMPAMRDRDRDADSAGDALGPGLGGTPDDAVTPGVPAPGRAKMGVRVRACVRCGVVVHVGVAMGLKLGLLVMDEVCVGDSVRLDVGLGVALVLAVHVAVGDGL